MNAKTMAVFAIVIMLVGCAAVLTYADEADVSADDTADKTVYVVKDQTAKVNIKQTLNALNSYYNTIEWTYSNNSTDTAIPQTEDGAADVGSVLIWMDSFTGTTSPGKEVPSNFVIHVEGDEVTSSAETISVKMTITSKVDSEYQGLVQTIMYTLNVNVLPSTFTIDEIDSVNNHAAVGESGYIEPVYRGVDYSAYVFYAIGLPNGVAMDSQGRISGTPNVTNWTDSDGDNVSISGDAGSRVATYTVTVVATHVASNLAIIKTFEFKVNEVSNSFTLQLSGTNVLNAGTGVYKTIEDTPVTIKIDGFKTGSEYTIFAIDSNNVQNPVDTINSESGITYTPTGTGKITIVATCGSEQAVVNLFVVDPVEDIETGIGFVTGSNVQD